MRYKPFLAKVRQLREWRSSAVASGRQRQGTRPSFQASPPTVFERRPCCATEELRDHANRERHHLVPSRYALDTCQT